MVGITLRVRQPQALLNESHSRLSSLTEESPIAGSLFGGKGKASIVCETGLGEQCTLHFDGTARFDGVNAERFDPDRARDEIILCLVVSSIRLIIKVASSVV
jgi:hypothetical protein